MKLRVLVLILVGLNSIKIIQAQKPKLYVNSVGIEFVLIQSGSFMMGSPDGEGRKNEHPLHKVMISKSFYMGKYEVTQTEWQEIMGYNPSHFKGSSLPVESVTYEDILIFIKKLNAKEKDEIYRLPTEAEWEYACRSGSKSEYFFGEINNVASLDNYAWSGDNSENTTHPVGQKKPNSWGLYDMYGNVWEWCYDWYGENYYMESPLTDPTGPEIGQGRVMRGSDFVNPAQRACRSAIRVSPRSLKGEDKGFRLVKLL